jgi:hypothetical protein
MKALTWVTLVGGLALGVPVAPAAQTQPPISGVTGTVALEGTIDQEQAAAGTVVVKTMDGVRHVFHFTKGLLVHGGKSGGVEGLQGLREGTTVAVHYTVANGVAAAQEIDQIGPDGLRVTEGRVIDVNRARKQITIRFDDGRTETLRLTDRAAADAAKDVGQAAPDAARVIVYYSDESGQKVAHYFKKTTEDNKR